MEREREHGERENEEIKRDFLHVSSFSPLHLHFIIISFSRHFSLSLHFLFFSSFPLHFLILSPFSLSLSNSSFYSPFPLNFLILSPFSLLGATHFLTQNEGLSKQMYMYIHPRIHKYVTEGGTLCPGPPTLNRVNYITMKYVPCVCGSIIEERYGQIL